MRILLVDDDPQFRSFMHQGLTESGVACVLAADVEEARAALGAEDESGFDLVLLDIMLPGSPGWTLLEELRAAGDATPVLFLTALQSVDDRVRGLELGADDYLIKPVELREVLARIHAVKRRHDRVPPVRIGELRVDAFHRTVERAGSSVELTPREYQLLLTLATAPGRVFSRSEILRTVWQIEFDPGTNVVDVHLARLRRKLVGLGAPIIETRVGAGYRLIPDEERV